MKKLFSSIAAISLSIVGFSAAAENASPDASPEAKASATTVEAVAPEAAPAVRTTGNFEVPQLIADHIAIRFPGCDVQGITREGVTYVVNLENGLHLRYDNCFNPVCYGYHNHEH